MNIKYRNLSKEEQIKKLKKENIVLLICAIICTAVIVILSVFMLIKGLDKSLAIGFILVLPISWALGYFLPKKENNKKIRKLESELSKE